MIWIWVRLTLAPWNLGSLSGLRFVSIWAQLGKILCTVILFPQAIAIWIRWPPEVCTLAFLLLRPLSNDLNPFRLTLLNWKVLPNICLSLRLENEDFLEKQPLCIVWILIGPDLPFSLHNTQTHLAIRTSLLARFPLHVSERKLWKKGILNSFTLKSRGKGT